jgi:hypothetical protein
MGQVLLLKIDASGIPVEMTDSADEITLASYTVQGGGPVLGATGLDLNNQDVADIKDINFNDSSTATITIASGAMVADKLMFESKKNSMDVEAGVLFPVVTDDVDELDAFRLPAIAGTPSATPTSGGAGHFVYDSTNKKPYIWDGTAWDDLSLAESAKAIDDSYTADEALAIRDAVYLSAADNVSKAKGDADASSRLLGFAIEGVSDTDPVLVRKFGVLGGFSGLTAGSRYFLSAATAGAVTATLPVGSGNVIVQAGYAKSATELDIQIQQLGKRA